MDEEEVTQEEFETRWLSPVGAVTLTQLGPMRGTPAILQRLCAGTLRSVVGELVLQRHGEEPQHAKLIPLTPSFWQRAEWAEDFTSPFWFSLGDKTLPGTDPQTGMPQRTDLFDVRFEPTAVRRLVPTAVIHAKAPENESSGRRGPKTKEFWEPMWAAIAAQAARGELATTKQADVQRAMEDWLSDNDHDAGETAVKQRVKAFWEAFNKGR